MIEINLPKFFIISFLAFIMTNCSNFESKDIIIKDAHLYVPLNGSMMTSGYLSISNTSNKIIQVIGIDCAPYRTEMHETKMNSVGTIQMNKIESFILNPKTNTIFVPGGKHVMFWGLGDYKKDKLDCSFVILDREPIKFEFAVIKRG